MPHKAQRLLCTVGVLAAHETDELDPHTPIPQLESGLCDAGSPVPGKMWDTSLKILW